MKKIFLFLVLLLAFAFMPNVYAKEANVTIKSIEKVDVTGKAKEVSEATISNGTLNFNLLFLDVGDSIKYKVVVENNDSEDYSLVINSDDEYVVYQVENGTVKKNATSEVTLIAKYNKEVPVEQKGQQITKTVKVNVSDKNGDIVNTVLSNPKTGQSMIFLLIILSVLIITLFVIKNKKVRTMILLLTAMFIPAGVSALNSLILTINSTYEIGDENIVYISDVSTYSSSIDNYTDAIIIGNELPSNITRYYSTTQAFDAWKNTTVEGVSVPFCLKLILSDNVVEEAYVIYAVTQDMVENNPYMVAGEYSLKIEKVYNYINNNFTCVNGTDSCVAEFYNNNVATIRTAYGNHDQLNFGNDDIYWSNSSLYIDPDSNGYLNFRVIIGEHRVGCSTDGDGKISIHYGEEASGGAVR